GHHLAAAKGRAGETYILAGPPLTYREFFRAAERATGLPAPRVWLPSQLAEVLARALRQASPALAEVLENASGISYLARADKARRELGWSARTVEAGLPETIEWLKTH
ncbi:MAG: NAD-dependent epimerase/dehydratase family protein, partial [Anaerolineales bacterium]